jgi:hypothetical protein
MGEYLSQHDTNEADGAMLLAKIGTADDFRYIRRAELERLAGSRIDYLGMARAGLGDLATLYRVPWPDEDAQPFDSLQGRDDMSAKMAALANALWCHHAQGGRTIFVSRTPSRSRSTRWRFATHLGSSAARASMAYQSTAAWNLASSTS